jgi:hypothetical protein
VFQFPSDEALLFALSAGLVPPAVAASPARVGRIDGRPWLAPAAPLPELVAASLARIGVENVSSTVPGRDIEHWLEAVALRPDPAPPSVTDRTPVLFEVSDATSLAPLVAELMRLGNDRQAIRRIVRPHSGGAVSTLLRVVGPPYYTLLQALDPADSSAPRAYFERAPGVWIQAGWMHPLARRLRPAVGRLLLLRQPAEWVAIDDRPFRDVYELLDLRPPSAMDWADESPGPLVVPLRLAAAGDTEPAELWVLHGPAAEQVDSFVRDADPRDLARLAFAVGELDGGRVVILRARPGRGELPGDPAAPGTPAFDGALACRPYLRLPNLYLPVGSRLRPPLRREATRRLLTDDPDRVVWLAARTGGSFVPFALPESAFRPLADWVDDVLAHDASVLTRWLDAARFDFASFVGRANLAPRTTSQRVKGEKHRSPPSPSKQGTGGLSQSAEPPPAAPAEVFTAGPATPPSELQARLKQIENDFLSIRGPLDDPRRLALWPRLARLYSQLGHKADAGAAWANALWETTDPPAAWTWAWVEAEQALSQPDITAEDVDRLLANARPAADDVRLLPAAVVWASRGRSPELLRRSAAVQQYLERHDHLLSVRAAWLAWQALTGGPTDPDVLALAHARDRILERLLVGGLVPERDQPGFLRFAGRPEGDRMRIVRVAAERLRQLVRGWFEQSTTIKGRFDRTPAYIDLFFAFGMARLGEATPARALIGQAAAAIEQVGTETHTFLLQAMQYRVEQALAGRPHAGPLPPEQREYLDQMRQEEKVVPIDETARRSASYAVERLGKESTILQPQEKLDPYRRIKLEQDLTIRELVRLTDEHDHGRLGVALRRLAEQATTRPAEVRLRVLAEALPLSARVGESATADLLAQVTPALDAAAASDDRVVAENRAVLLERALLFAAHYDLPDLVRSFADRLGEALRRPVALDAIGSLVGQTLRSLRKLGLKEQTERLLGQIADAALGGRSLEQTRAALAGRDWQHVLRLVLPVAGAWFDFDRPADARPILDAARAWLLKPDKKPNDPDRPPAQYVTLVNAYIAAAGHAPLDEAIGRIEELFGPGRLDRLPNTMTSNHYYSLLHLSVAETVVLTLATEEFAVGPAARRWLDDDEYLVRRRIHRDMRAALARAGM